MARNLPLVGILLLVLLAALPVSTLSADDAPVWMQNRVYVEGENATLSIAPAYQGRIALRVQVGTQVYRYAGDDASTTMTLTATGEHVVTVFDRLSGELVQEFRFQVDPAPLSNPVVLSPGPYRVGEPIVLSFSIPDEYTPEVWITTPTTRLRFGGDVRQAVTYVPTQEGNYSVELTDFTTSMVYAKDFSVENASGVPPSVASPAQIAPSVPLAPAAQDPADLKGALQQRFPGVVVESAVERGDGHDVRAARGGSSIELRGARDARGISALAFRRSSAMGTETVFVGNVSVQSATIVLAKLEPIRGIARCDEYDADLDCRAWIPTEIPYADNGTHVTFTVDHFTGYGGVPQSAKYYVTSSANYTAPANVSLALAQDGAENNNQLTVAASTFYNFINATYATPGPMTISTTSVTNFSTYWTMGRINSAYATFKLYKGTTGPTTLICQDGNDNTGGRPLPASQTTGMVYGNCTPSSDVTVSGSERLYMVVNVYVSSVGTSAKTIQLRWDTATADTWMLVRSLQGTDIFVAADGTQYARGATVGISGVYYHLNGTPVPSTNVTVNFLNTVSGSMQLRNVTTAADGSYSDTYVLPSDAAFGTWRANVTGWATGAYAVNSTTFQVANLPPVAGAVAISPHPVMNDSTVSLSATVTDPDGVSAVFLELFYPNGTLWQNLSTTGTGPYVAATTMPSLPIGNYTITVFANDTTGLVSETSRGGISTYAAFSGPAAIALDGSFADWAALLNFTDPSGDVATAAMHWAAAGASNPPAGRYGAGITFDLNLNTTILFGGYNESGACDGTGAAGECNGTFIYNATNNTWQQLSNVGTVIARDGIAMTFDPNLNATVMFGGISNVASCDSSGGVYCNGTYIFNATAMAWQRIAITTPPTARSDPRMVFDPNLNATILFGGYGPSGCDGMPAGVPYCNGTYILNISGNKWQRLNVAASPRARDYHAMTFDHRLNATIVYGGRSNGACDGSNDTYCNGTYLFNISANRWDLLPLGSNPAGRYSAGVAYNPVLNGTVIFGGSANVSSCDGSPTGTCNGTYLLNATSGAWQALAAFPPVRRTAPMMVFDQNLNKVLIFGGSAPAGTDGAPGSYVNGTYILTLPGADDIVSSGITNSQTALFAKLQIAGGPDGRGGGPVYRAYFGNGAGGSATTPEGAPLPFSYTHRAQVSWGTCTLYSNSGSALGSCTYAAGAQGIELSVPLSLLDAPGGTTLNVTFETVNATASRRDAAPDQGSFVSYAVLIRELSITSTAVTPAVVSNGTPLNISANIAASQGAVFSAAWAELSHANGTAYRNLTLRAGGGSTYYNDTFASPSSPLGNYTVVIYANDSDGTVYSGSQAGFVPYVVIAGASEIDIDGSFADWSAATSIADENETFYSLSTNNTWVRKGSLNGPYARYGAAMVYDPNLGTLLMFGGRNGTTGVTCDGSGSSYCNGTYKYNWTTETWVPLASANPPTGRYIHAMVFDPVLNMTLLYGGAGASGCDGSGAVQCNGTYGYNASSNSWTALRPSNPPVARQGHGMAFNPVLNMTILWGGYKAAVGCDGATGNYCNGTYGYNVSSNAWVNLGAASPPVARNAMGMAHDLVSNLTIIFGGNIQSGGNCDGDIDPLCGYTFGYNASSNSWSNLYPFVSPPQRTEPEMAFDPLSQTIILFGGDVTTGSCESSGNRACNGTYAYDGSVNSWSSVAPTSKPGPRFYHALGYDEQRNKIVVFGGNNGQSTSPNCDGSGSAYCNSTYAYSFHDLTLNESLDIASSSVAGNASHLLLRLNAEDAINSGLTYRAYLGNGSAGSGIGVGGSALAFNYSHRIDVTGGTCTLYASSGANLGACGYASAGSSMELSVPFSTIGVAVGNSVNVSFETASATGRHDAAPGMSSRIALVMGGITFSGVTLNASYPPGGSMISATSTVTPVSVTIDAVRALVYYPNASLYASYPMTGSGTYANGSIVVPSSPTGNYSVYVVANDTTGVTYASEAAQFAPVPDLSQIASITVDGSFSDWNGLAVLQDRGGDAGSAGYNTDIVTAENWSKFHSDLNNTGYTTNTAAPNVSRHIANFTTGNIVSGGPAVAGGYVYVGSDNGKVYQLNASNISQQIANYTIGSAVRSIPAVAGGYVYIGGGDGRVYQLNASNISQQIANYTYSAGLAVNTAPAVSGGFLYLGSIIGYLYQLNASNISQQIANFSGSQTITSTAVAGGYVYVGQSLVGLLYQLNASNISKQIANFSTATYVETPGGPAVAGGYVYIGDSGNTVYQLNASNISQQIANFSGPSGYKIFSAPAVAGGYVYVGSNDRNVYQLNASNISQQIANYTTGGRVESSPAVAGGYVYIGSVDDRLYQLNASNISQQIANYTTGNDIYASPAVAGGFVYVGSWDGRVYQLGGISTVLGPDIVNVSVANSASHLFAELQVNGSLDLAATQFYRVYLGNGTAGSSTSPEGNALPFTYTHRAQVNGSACQVYSSAGVDLGACSYANDSQTLEISVPLSVLGASIGDAFNVTFETASAEGRYDLAPDMSSFLRYALLAVDQPAGPPVISNVTGISAVTPLTGQNVTVRVNFTATNPAGVDGIVDSSALVNFSSGTLSFSGGCTPNDGNSTSTIFNCSVQMPYWAPAGSWQVNVSFTNGTASASNSTTAFTYNTLESFALSTASYNFGALSVGESRAGDPLVLDNRGNADLAAFSLTAYDLRNGESYIGAGNITVNISNAPGTALVNDSAVAIPGATLSADTAAGDQNRTLYLYINTPAVPARTYTSEQNWVMTNG